jgi:hypothetical protein
VNGQFGILEKNRIKKWESLYVIPMGVAEENMQGVPTTLAEYVLPDFDTQVPYTRAGVEDDIIVFILEGDAGRIAAVFFGYAPWRRD